MTTQTPSKSVFLLFKNRVLMGKTRIAPNALKIEQESYDTIDTIDHEQDELRLFVHTRAK